MIASISPNCTVMWIILTSYRILTKQVNANWKVKSEDMSNLCNNVTKQVNAYWRINRQLIHGNRDKVGDGSKPIHSHCKEEIN